MIGPNCPPRTRRDKTDSTSYAVKFLSQLDHYEVYTVLHSSCIYNRHVVVLIFFADMSLNNKSQNMCTGFETKTFIQSGRHRFRPHRCLFCQQIRFFCSLILTLLSLLFIFTVSLGVSRRRLFTRLLSFHVGHCRIPTLTHNRTHALSEQIKRQITWRHLITHLHLQLRTTPFVTFNTACVKQSPFVTHKLYILVTKK